MLVWKGKMRALAFKSHDKYSPNVNWLFETKGVCMYLYDLNKEIRETLKLIISAVLLVLSFTTFVALDVFFLLPEFENALSIYATYGLTQWGFM